MHVLVTADTVGGVWTYARELVTGLVKCGVQVTLVSFGDIPASGQTDWMDGLAGLDYRPTAFRLEWMQDAPEDVEASSDYLLRVVGEVNPELLHLNQYCYGSLPIDIPRVVVAHSDVVSWWANVRGEAPPDTAWSRWYRNVVTRCVEGASAMVAPSRFMLEALVEHYGRPKRNAVVYNGRNPHLFSPHVGKDGYIMSVGRIWDGGKQTRLLLERELHAPLYLVGPQEHPDPAILSSANASRFQGSAAKTSAGKSPANRGTDKDSKRVHFLGTQSEGQLRRLYSRASMYAATSRYEPFGLAPLEAALSRCAIIANDIPSFREIWGDAACYFERDNAESLARTLDRLGADPIMEREYANRAYRRAIERYTSDRMVAEYIALYRALLGKAEAAA
jgi:glycogen synthase